MYTVYRSSAFEGLELTPRVTRDTYCVGGRAKNCGGSTPGHLNTAGEQFARGAARPKTASHYVSENIMAEKYYRPNWRWRRWVWVCWSGWGRETARRGMTAGLSADSWLARPGHTAQCASLTSSPWQTKR